LLNETLQLIFNLEIARIYTVKASLKSKRFNKIFALLLQFGFVLFYRYAILKKLN